MHSWDWRERRWQGCSEVPLLNLYGGDAVVSCRAVTDLAILVRAPGEDLSVRRQSKRVREVIERCGPTRGHLDDPLRCRQTRRTAPVRRRQPVAELTVQVVAPGAGAPAQLGRDRVVRPPRQITSLGGTADTAGQHLVGPRASHLSVVVGAPCPRRAVAASRQRVETPGRNSNHVTDPAPGGISDLGREGAVLFEPVADLSRSAVPPGPYVSVGGQGETMASSHGDSLDVGEVGHLDWCGAVGRRPVAQLSIGIGSPRPDNPVRLERHGVRWT